MMMYVGLGVVGGGLWFKIGCRGWQLGNGEDHVVTSGGNVSVADGGGARGGIVAGSLMAFVEDLLYRLLFTLDIGNVFL